MIIFFENGRLGNQLFQYCSLRHYFSNHNLILLGCDDLQRCFGSLQARFISKNMLSHSFLFRLLRRVVQFLVNARLLGRITEDSDAKVFKLALRKGLFWNIYVAQGVFFQHHDVVAKQHSFPDLRPELLKEAFDWLKKKGVDLEASSAVFVHIRRGDYLHFPSTQFPAVLDLDWYQRAMQSIQEEIKNPVFILISDDQFYLHDIFEESDRLFISDNLPEIDFALMSLCSSGILSESSFAWWGAFYARSNQQISATFLAPKFWIGHRAKKWFPANFLTDWITYFD